MARAIIEFNNGEVVTVEGDDGGEVETILAAVADYFGPIGDDTEAEQPTQALYRPEPPLADWERDLLNSVGEARDEPPIGVVGDEEDLLALAAVLGMLGGTVIGVDTPAFAPI